MISYYAYSASSELAEERGPYETFKGSLGPGILPLDSMRLLEQERGRKIDVDKVLGSIGKL